MACEADLIIYGAREILKLEKPVRGFARSEDLGVIEDGAIAIRGGLVIDVGPEDEILRRFRGKSVLDAGRSLVTPGLVDPHTHLVYSGSREDERELMLKGISYEEILSSGGGITRTMIGTSKTSEEELVRELLERLNILLDSGVTTVEIKTGYGISIEDELRLLRVLKIASRRHPIRVVPTLLAHIKPPNSEDYAKLFAETLVPKASGLADFVDVFCERGAFSPEEARKILRGARSAGLGVRIHADEFSYIGCSDVGLELGASSIDHLNHSPDEIVSRIASSDSVAVLAPSTAIAIVGKKPPSRKLLEKGAIVAIATDHSPALMNLDMVETIELAVNYLSLPPGNAIAAATINAAYSLGLIGSSGSISPGTPADIVIWKLPSYRWLGYSLRRRALRAVIIGGSITRLWE